MTVRPCSQDFGNMEQRREGRMPFCRANLFLPLHDVTTSLEERRANECSHSAQGRLQCAQMRTADDATVARDPVGVSSKNKHSSVHLQRDTLTHTYTIQTTNITHRVLLPFYSTGATYREECALQLQTHDFVHTPCMMRRHLAQYFISPAWPLALESRSP